MSCFVDAALDVFIGSPILVDYAAKVNKCVNFFNVVLLNSHGVLLLVVDPHCFCLAGVDFKSGLSGFFSNSTQLLQSGGGGDNSVTEDSRINSW